MAEAARTLDGPFDGGPTEIERDDHDPALLIVRPPHRVSDEAMADFLEEHRLWEAARTEPYAMVLDLRFCQKITSEQRQMLTDGMAGMDEEVPCRGLAMIFESRVLKGILTMIFWVRKPPYPTRVFNELLPAMVWAKSLVPQASEPSATKQYWVQGDASFDGERADALVELANAAGFSARITKKSRAEREIYVPRAGPFPTYQEALDAVAVLATVEFEGRVISAGDAI